MAGLAGVIASAVLAQATDLVTLFAILFGGLFMALLGAPAAKAWRSGSRASGLLRVASIPLLAGAAEWLTARAVSVYAVVSLAAAWLGVYLITLSLASSRLSPEAVAVRSTMRRARKHLKKRLALPEPAIPEAWTPWLIAFGLDGSTPSWWRSHRGEAAAASPESWSSSSSPSSSSSAAFGGGGGW